jgi:hypothetical protein
MGRILSANGLRIAPMPVANAMKPEPREIDAATSRLRVWQDAAAESLLGSAVGLIALTGVNPLVHATNLWLADVVTGIDPVVTMLALVILLTAVLVLAGIRLKAQARRVATERTRFAQAGARAEA